MTDTNKPESEYRTRALEVLIDIAENASAYNARTKAAKIILQHTGKSGTFHDEAAE